MGGCPKAEGKAVMVQGQGQEEGPGHEDAGDRELGTNLRTHPEEEQSA